MKSQDTSSSSVSRTELNERVMEINSLRQELERTKKDKNITTGLVTQMQRDMTSKVRNVTFEQFLCLYFILIMRGLQYSNSIL